MVVLGMHPAKTCTPARSLVFAWRHAAHASRPLRPRAAILAAALALACGRQASQQAPLETVRGVPIHAAVVAHIAARDGVDEATALERARQTARLAHDFDRKAGLPGHAIPPARIAQLRRRALARLWLTEAFEPAHRAEDIPRQALEQGLEDVRVFHPRLHFVCQAIVIPDLPRVDGQPIPEFPDDPATRAQAVAYGDRLAARMVRYVSAPEHESDCKWIEHVTRQSTPPPEGLRLRVEGAAFDACREDLFDAGFVAAICPRDTTGWVAPFWTRYGLHVAAITRLEPDTRAPDDDARIAVLRREYHAEWSGAALAAELARLRTLHVAKLAVSVESAAP